MTMFFRSLAAALLAAALLAPAQAQVPQRINYQGYLTSNAGVPVNELVKLMVFRLYNAPTGSKPLWEETQSSVAVANGVFNVVLGSVTPIALPFNAQYYLGVQLNGDQEMSPRQPLASVPYALNPGPIARAVHGCFPGQANATGPNYAVTYTGASTLYAMTFAGGALQTAGYTVLVEARTSKGRSYSLVAGNKSSGGITLTGGWLDDDGETVASICFLMAE